MSARRCLGLLAVALVAVPPIAVAKEEYSLRICGSSGCNVVRDDLEGAALASAASDYAEYRRHIAGPHYTVRFIAPGGRALPRAYRLPVAFVRNRLSGSEPRAADPLRRATSGVRPYGIPSDRGRDDSRWIVAAAVIAALMATAIVHRARRRRAEVVRVATQPEERLQLTVTRAERSGS